MAGVRYVFVTCAECGAEVDRVEYDDGAAAPAVQAVADSLDISVSEAADLVAAKNPGAELSSEDNARALAEAIAAEDVKGRAKGTYVCPFGHKGSLAVGGTPTPSVRAAIEKVSTK